MIKLQELRDDAASCTRCDLDRHATRTIFGEAPASAGPVSDLVLARDALAEAGAR